MAVDPDSVRPKWQKLSAGMLTNLLGLQQPLQTAHHFTLAPGASQQEFMDGYLTWIETHMLLEREFIKSKLTGGPEHIRKPIALSIVAHHLPTDHPARKQPEHMQQMLDHFHDDRCVISQFVGFLDFAAKGQRPSGPQLGWLRQTEARLGEIDRWLGAQIQLLDMRDASSLLQRKVQFSTITATGKPGAEESFEDICDKRNQLVKQPIDGDYEHDMVILEDTLRQEYGAAQAIVQSLANQLGELQEEFKRGLPPHG